MLCKLFRSRVPFDRDARGAGAAVVCGTPDLWVAAGLPPAPCAPEQLPAGWNSGQRSSVCPAAPRRGWAERAAAEGHSPESGAGCARGERGAASRGSSAGCLAPVSASSSSGEEKRWQRREFMGNSSSLGHPRGPVAGGSWNGRIPSPERAWPHTWCARASRSRQKRVCSLTVLIKYSPARKYFGHRYPLLTSLGIGSCSGWNSPRSSRWLWWVQVRVLP